MNEKSNKEFSENSNTNSSQKFGAATNSPFDFGNSSTPPTDGTPSTCLAMKAITEAKARYSAPAGEVYIAFGASFLRPPADVSGNRVLTSPLMTPEMRLKQLELWDRCEAALVTVQHAFETRPPKGRSEMKKLFAPVDTSMKRLLHISAQLCREIEANKAQYEAKGAPTEQELVDAYEAWQYERRKALGEPVLFRDGRLCFEKSVFEAGYQPGPFPGLDLYTRDGKLVDRKAFDRWLNDAKARRKETPDEGVGFFGCPVCGLHAADMVWYYGRLCGTHGSESYRERVKLAQGMLHPQPTLNSALIRGMMLANNPLPCMARD